ncbi:MAG TPA: lysophospholipid acyltransferase family protein [Acidiferrobacterales bacterium]|nr:lysophospholipid acyltransferase family protein [Acidiferrobacterales bacterium]
MAEAAREYTARDFLHPRYLPDWLALGFLRTVALLPLPLIWLIGGVLGTLLYFTMSERRHITLTNIRRCFPELATAAHRGLAQAHFRAFTQAALATPIAWWGSAKRLKRLVRMPGQEHLECVLAEKKPVILLVAHFVAIEIGGVALAPDHFVIDLYKRPKNRFFDYLIRARRRRFGGLLVERRESIKPVIRGIKKGGVFFYLSDQDQGRDGAVFAPFFGIPAATLTALSRLAQLTGAVVIPAQAKQLPWGKGYELIFQPPLENFPTDDVLADTTRMNKIIEDAVREMPEQYFWSHRRFKTRPEGEGPFY